MTACAARRILCVLAAGASAGEPSGSARLCDHPGELTTADGTTSVKVFPLLPRETCRRLIDAAETAAARTGWRTDRHKAYPTTDLEVRSTPELWSLVKPYMGEVSALASEALGLAAAGAEALDFHDLFLVRYDAAGQRSLDGHSDGSRVTFQVTLSEAGVDFEGGGTFFDALGCAVRPDPGVVLAFPGNLVHSGVGISSGKRYVLVGFSRHPSVSEDYSHFHLSFEHPFSVDLGRFPCLTGKDATGRPRLRVDLVWTGDSGSTFAVEMDASSGRVGAQLLWIQRQARTSSDSGARQARRFELPLPQAATDAVGAGQLTLLALPPGHEYESVKVSPCIETVL